MPPNPAGGVPKPLSAGGTAAAPKQNPHTGGWSGSRWGGPDKEPVRVGRSPLVSQQDGGEQGGQEGASLTPVCPSAAHPGGQEADLGGHGQHRGVPAGVPLLHRGHGRAQQLPAVSGVSWGCFGGWLPTNGGFNTLGGHKGLCGVFCVLARARVGSGRQGEGQGCSSVPAGDVPSAAGIPGKEQRLARAEEGLWQQEWLWCVPAGECTGSSSTEGLQSNGKVKGRAPAEH